MSILAAKIVRKAFYLSNVKDPREQLEGFELSEGIELLNTILDDWGSKSIYIPNYQLVNISVVANDYDYVVTTPIVQVMEAHLMDSTNVLSNLTVANQQLQNVANYSLVVGRPTQVFIQNLDNAEPNLSTVFFFPTPDQAYTATLRCKQRLANVTSQTDITALPRFYYKVLVYQLAWDLSIENMTVLPDKFEKEYNKLIREVQALNRRDGSVQNVNPYRGVRYYRPWGVYVV